MKNGIDVCTVYFSLTLLIKIMCFLISMFLCFALVIGTENRGFALVLVPNTEM